MKRITAAALAATTALSLAAVPAQAEEGNQKDFSDIVSPDRASDVTDGHLAAAKLKAEARELRNEGSGYSGPYKSSSEKNLVPKSAKSSLKNDVARGYKLGTTYDILVGTGIAAGVLALVGAAAAAAGKIPGVPGAPAVEQFF
ncbi:MULTISPECIES: hypothetical protein [Corynebacterium]|uniref:Secreted protein n=1 Tax=Corynebacterium ihumii TaxID=1232427 RepID=A0ABY7UH09_9CORY|nr:MULTISPECIES: hypothetical protein [Corynebacterium]WCZ35568.1 hypothetical protein CIHUM_10900 [Corynebacterium ihumii]